MQKMHKHIFAIPAALLCAYFTSWFLCCGILFAQNQYDNINSVKIFQSQFCENLGIQIAFLAVFLLSAMTFFSFFRKPRKAHLSSFLLGSLYAVIFIFGLCQQCSDNAFFFIPGTGAFFRFGMLLSFSVLFFCVIEMINEKLNDIAASREKHQAEVCLSTQPFLIVSLVLFLSWLPYFIFSYPGSVCYDARSQFEQFFGAAPYSNNNPFFDTVIYGILFRIGELLGRSGNAGIAMNIAVQLLLFSFSFAYCAETVYYLTRSRKIEGALVFFYAVLPIYGGAVQIVLKNSLHLAVVMWYFSLLVRMLYLPVTKRTVRFFSVAFLLAAFTRKAALLYILAGGLVLLILVRKRTYAKKLLISIVLCVSCFLLTENILFPLLNVAKAPNTEILAFPIQSVSYITKQRYLEMPEETLRKINEIIGVENILKNFNPNLADSMKYHYKGNGKAFLQLIVSLIKQYPKDFLQSIVTVSWKYAFPYSTGNAPFRSYMLDFSYLGRDIYFVWPELHDAMVSYANSWSQSPILTLFIGPGLYCWIFLFAAVRALQQKMKDSLVILLPLGVLLVGLLFTPLNGETRYAYPLIGMAPAVFAWVSSCPRQCLMERTL